MLLQIHIEEPSAEAALRNLLPKLVGADTDLQFIVYNGKPDLLRKLPDRLQGLRSWMPDEMRIIILIDRDNEDCYQLKQLIEEIIAAAGLLSKSESGNEQDFQVLNRQAIEELEAWFFGDTEAMHRAYPRIPAHISARPKYNDPDDISGGTWESLERLLIKNGYYQARMPKIEVAERISMHMDPVLNRSKSFQVFRDGIIALLNA